ncbi:MAG: NUDIX domain-containing protein [Burkholderiales bacterium]|nr:NUDIX domain-containing protein [Burkholderiales bacterium]
MEIAQKSAGIVIVRHAEMEYQFLILRAYRNWDFPKGLVEPGESFLQTAIRETTEETGLSDLRFPWDQVFIETAPYAKGKIARFYLAETAEGEVHLAVNPDLGRPEHHEYRWVRHEAAALLLPERLRLVLAWALELVSRKR